MDLRGLIDSLNEKKFPIPFSGHFVDGKWQELQQERVIKQAVSPNSGAALYDIRLSKGVIHQAIEAASVKFEKHNPTPMHIRFEILKRLRQGLTDFQDTLIKAMVIEGGKPIWEAQNEISGTLNYLDRVASLEEVDTSSLLGPVELGVVPREVSLEPIGITCAWLPFSSPCLNFAYTFAASVVADSPLVLFVSGNAGICGSIFASIYENLKIEPNLMQVVISDFVHFNSALSDSRIKGIIYTGSREHCELIRRERAGVKGRQLILQSGGKNSVYIDDSADIEQSARATLLGSVKSAGQLCSSTSRVFLPKDSMVDWVDCYVQMAKKIEIGPTDGDNSDVVMGPLYSNKAVEKFLRFQTMAKRESKSSPLWGKKLETGVNGFFVTPGLHILDQFDSTSAYQANVLMCPDVAVYVYESQHEAIHCMNATDAQLVVSLFGEESKVAGLCHSLSAPNVLINSPTIDIELHPGIAGKNQCGHHRLSGVGLAFLLSYPKAIVTASIDGKGLIAWPFSRN